MDIGFIGVGHMGSRMARRLLEAGHSLTVHDLRKEAAQPLLAKGARWADTPKAVAESCRVVLASLPGPPEVEQVVYGANGLMAGWKQGDTYIDTTTNLPGTIQRVAKDAKAKGVAVLEAPVSGGVDGAEAGTLSIMVGGDARTLEEVRKVLEVIGKNIFHVGDVGCGNIAKLVNNLIAMTCRAIIDEGFVLGVKAGIDPKKLWEVVTASSGDNRMLRGFPKATLQGNFEPGFRLALACKDVGLALALGRECGVPLAVGAAVEQKFLEAKAAGLGEKGSQALILRLEEVAGVQVRSPER